MTDRFKIEDVWARAIFTHDGLRGGRLHLLRKRRWPAGCGDPLLGLRTRPFTQKDAVVRISSIPFVDATA